MVRFAGEREWIVKRSISAWLIGMATATVMLSSGRKRAAGKILAALAALFAIVLGQALLIILAPTAGASPPHDPQAWLRLLIGAERFGTILPLICALAIAGSAARFILARSD